MDEVARFFGDQFFINDEVPPTSWRHDGPMNFEFDGGAIVGLASSYILLGAEDSGGRIRVAEHVPSAAREGLIKGRLVADVDGIPVVGEHAFLRFDWDDPAKSSFVFELNELVVGSPYDANAALTRETILGVRLSEPFPFGFRTAIFGRDAMISDCASITGGAKDSVGIVYEGAPIPFDKRWALHDVLRFVCGTRGNSTFVEAFDGNGKRLGFRVRNGGAAKPPKQFLQPLDLRPWGAINSLAGAFPIMLDRMLTLRANNAPGVSATIHHYNDGSVQTYPTSRLRDLSVALDALFCAVKEKQARRMPMPGVIEFADRMVSVMKAFDLAFENLPSGSHSSPSEKDRIRQKLVEANLQSPRQEVFEFFEDLDIGFQRFEKKLINYFRNGVLHVGHTGDESEKVILERNDRAANGIANIYHRAFLRVLGFEGLYRDAHDHEQYELREVPDYKVGI